jgi:acyl-CoA synthetase (AMP-forming)/AMP-acid ligase II
VSAGYLPDPDEERLSGGRFRAGDLAVWQEGELALQGRVDDLVNIKGKKVNPREVEAILAGLPGVDEAVVLGVPVACRGEVLRAVVACRPGRLTAGEVVAWCRSHLSAHKVPRSVILVAALPRNARGKLDRPALLALGTDDHA